MTKYNHEQTESKWRQVWERDNLYSTPKEVTPENKMYILPQLPYPSGAGLHVGHAEVYFGCDIFARYERMKGKKVLQVLGWDAFGLPAENYAIKTNLHPRINTDNAINNFREQIQSLGISVDWSREVGSHNPDYYKWTQWFFLFMYERGLAYRKKQAVNWCDSCKTVLANEQVINGHCERCDTLVVQKEMEQWFLKITEYADRLIADLDKVDWPQETVRHQRNWIGRSQGAEITFAIKEQDSKKQLTDLQVFTTAHDTIFGATFIVLAPEHELVQELKDKIINWKNVEGYLKTVQTKTELERQQDKRKTGVILQGVVAINPVNDESLPIYIADYVLSTYGSGAIMAVPGHDERDKEFAETYQIPIIYLTQEQDFVSYSGGIKKAPKKYIVHNSEKYNGQDFAKARTAILADLTAMGVAKAKTQYKLRDWSISRQRFWGAPMPVLRRELSKTEEKYNKILQSQPELFIDIHALESSPDKHYHPWLQKELKVKGVKALRPHMPNPSEPKNAEWLEHIEQLVPGQDFTNTVLSGRSLGAWTALQIAEKYPVRKLVLVAPSTVVAENKANWKKHITGKPLQALLEFTREFPDFEKISKNAAEIVIFLSLNDPYINAEASARFYREHLPQARIITVRNALHFSADAGYEEFKLLLEEVVAPVRIDIKALTVKDLPVILPDNVDFKPTGQSPLTYAEHFQDGVEQKYGKGWKREVDTLDTFMCSSWYYYRYLDPHNDQEFASQDALNSWMPVDFYLGGPEHVNGHLLYSRFFTKVLYDAGIVNFDEPFLVHRHQGMILGADHRKMSKRWGNVINPTDVVKQYGADTLRIYEMFMGPLEQSKSWNDSSVLGVRRFVERVYQYSVERKFAADPEAGNIETTEMLSKVSVDTEKLKYNTAIAEFMKFINFAEKERVSKDNWQRFILALAPYAPYLCEEIWHEILGHEDSVHVQSWPEYDHSKLLVKEIEIAVQVDGKLRGTFKAKRDLGKEQAIELAQQVQNVTKYLENGYTKVIYVPGKLLNFITG